MGRTKQLRSRREILASAGRLSASGVIGHALISAALSSPAKAASAMDVNGLPVCTSETAVAGSTFYSEVAEAGGRMHHAMEIATSGDVDRDFMGMMIPHHQGAIDMALLQLKYGRDERLKRLAQSIIVEQGQEIAYMRSLLDKPSRERSAIHPAAER
jgi:uncharacterized protein (DUF305 family)